MVEVNYAAVGVAALAAFVFSALWNSPLLFGKARLTLRGLDPATTTEGRPTPARLAGEAVRCLVIAYVLARFVVLLNVTGWAGGLELGAWVWVGFQAALLLGAVLWENMPWRAYAIHAGDALARILLMGVILGAWR
ncbi:MAG: hypothetical protein JWP35_2255 [Caulobacter sp.]|nr:hypothetical protein [Caulobacter sp.]